MMRLKPLLFFQCLVMVCVHRHRRSSCTHSLIVKKKLLKAGDDASQPPVVIVVSAGCVAADYISEWICWSIVPYICKLGCGLGITTGNPGVFPGNLYPYLAKPTPVTMGVGFHGSG